MESIVILIDQWIDHTTTADIIASSHISAADLVLSVVFA
jgi:hypothetical protein